jgi:hypothetical protein
MGTASQEKVIGEFAYTVQQLPATRSLKLLHRLGKVAGMGLTQLASSGFEEITKADAGPVIAAVAAILRDTEPDETVGIIKELLVSSYAVGRDGKVDLGTPAFDNHFQGHLGDLFQVVAFALEVNYADFFGGLFAKLGAAKRAAKAPSSQAAS